MSRNLDHWDSARAFERDNEHEPARRFERPRVELNREGTLRVAHEAAYTSVPCATVERVVTVDPVTGSTAVVQYVQPAGPSWMRKVMRAHCEECGFTGREYGPASMGDAYDEARAHKCDGGGK